MLIIHADDAGMSHSVNVATIEAMEKGIVTSASILVPCPWLGEFAAYARKHPERDFGVHLTLTSEFDVYRWGPVAPARPGGEPGRRQGLPLARQRAGRSARQVERSRDRVAGADRACARHFGVPLSHLDTHMGTLLSRPDLLELYVNLGIEYQLPIMFTRQANDPRMLNAYPALRGRGQQLLDALDHHHLPVLESVLMFYQSGEHESAQTALSLRV